MRLEYDAFRTTEKALVTKLTELMEQRWELIGLIPSTQKKGEIVLVVKRLNWNGKKEKDNNQTAT